MSGFLSNLISKIFGRSKDKNDAPDDGGLAEFAKQLAKELEMEEKTGKRKTVSADSVLSVQHGKHGSKTYLLDTKDFNKAIVQELRDSVAPVTEGILKTRCGEKGVGYMNVKALYIFHVRREDPVAEFNAAMDIIDDIGSRLLGDRYFKGDRKVHIPVAQVLPEDLFDLDGTFDFKKAKKSLNWIRQAGTHGPASVDWEKGGVKVAEGAPDWVPDDIAPSSEEMSNWETQEINAQKEALGDWQEQEKNAEKEELGDWEKLNVKSAEKPKKEWAAIEAKPKKKQDKQWVQMEAPKAKTVEEKVWVDSPPAAKETTQNEAAEKPEPTTVPPKKPEAILEKRIRIHPTDLKDLGTLTLAFRPTWQASQESINAYAGCAYRSLNEAVFNGEQVYPDDMNIEKIVKIDTAIAQQAALHLQRTKQIEEKTIILPFHLQSLSIEKSQSPLNDLRALDDHLRNHIWIEIVGVGSNASPSKISSAIKSHHDKFDRFGIRFELGDLSRSLIERSNADFLSCDVDASNTHGLQMRSLDQDLPDLLNMAKMFKMDICTWGIKNRKDLLTAVQEGSNFINGHALAKEIRRPGKIIPVSASKLLTP